MSVLNSPIDDGSLQATFAATLVDEWIRSGVTHAVICPGSRSTPLAVALASRPEINVHVRLDERSAGFMALGLALDGGVPAVVCTTSGTAATELHASIVEAHHACIPMLVCTADRPPELKDVGAPQAIDQTHLFGTAVRWFVEPGPVRSGTQGTWRSLGSRSFLESVLHPIGPGPVHLNLAFVEPLLGKPKALPAGRAEGLSWTTVEARDVGFDNSDAASRVRSWRGRRGIVVVGARGGDPAAVNHLAQELGWPLLADPRSRSRRPGFAAIGSVDSILRDADVAKRLRPDFVLCLGDPWVSKVLLSFLVDAAEGGASVISVTPSWHRKDPERIVSQQIVGDPTSWAEWAAGVVGESGSVPVDRSWSDLWHAADDAAQIAIDDVINEVGAEFSEPAIARSILAAVPPRTRVVVSSSMPIRDLEWFASPMEDPPTVFANRGANGIDGVTSTAWGLASDGGGPVVAVMGDLAFLHDVSALVHPVHSSSSGVGEKAPSCVLVVIDNGGGGIFDFLPQATALPVTEFEALFGTPMVPDLCEVARGFGLPCVDVASKEAFLAAFTDNVGRSGMSVIRVRVPDRRTNVTIHEKIHAFVRSKVAEALALLPPDLASSRQ